MTDINIERRCHSQARKIEGQIFRLCIVPIRTHTQTSKMFFRRALATPENNQTNGQENRNDTPQTLFDRYENGKTLYKGRVSDIAQKATNWSLEVGGRNRPVDTSRMEELSNYIATNGFVPGVIYCFQKSRTSNWIAPSGDGTLYIYDGMHRFEAARNLLVARGIDLPVIFCVRQLRVDETEHVIQEEFTSLNKRVEVPEFYMQENMNLKLTQVVMRMVAYIAKTWPAFVSPAANPRVPNFSRDVLENRLYKMFEDLFQGDLPDIPDMEETIRGLESTIQEVNEELKSAIRTSGVDNSKAKQHGCYLFAYPVEPMSEFMQHLRKKIQVI